MKTLTNNTTRFLNKTEIILFLELLLMIACFFSWSENVVITRVIKAAGRVIILFMTYFTYRSIIRFGAINSVIIKNPLSPLLYLLYLILGFLSILWSTNPTYSILQWVMTTQTFIFSFYFVKCLFLLDVYFPENKIKIHSLLGNSSFVLITIFIIGMFFNPDVFFRLTHGGEERRLGGYMMNPNELGMLCGIGVACLIHEIYHAHKKVIPILMLIIIFYALYLTGSRSSLIGSILILFYYFNETKQRLLKISLITLILLISPFAIYKVILKDGDSKRIEEITSMTGRLPFWKALITEGLPREPLLGFGFMRIDYKEYFQSTHTYPGKMTHNTFIQVLMNLGFIGLTVVLFQLIFTFRAILNESNTKQKILMGISIPILINSFTEFGIYGESNYGILFFQLTIFLTSFRNQNFIPLIDQLLLKLKCKTH